MRVKNALKAHYPVKDFLYIKVGEKYCLLTPDISLIC